ncbi:response regulator [Hydrogenophaga sp. T2]|uniref:response regulator n=1 Tax=Hydrogenophaga sp. T2 TaxID=3132823 RepID=UPI003CED0CFE
MNPTRLLLVDDETAVLSALQRALRQRFGSALVVSMCSDAPAALERLRTHDVDLVISDLRMPVMDGIEFMRRVAVLRPHTVRMILTGSSDFATAQAAINGAGVFRYLCKPWQDDELAAHIEAAIAQAGLNAAQREAAQAWQDRCDAPSAEELERRRLEALEPGITHVEWGPDGEVLLPPITGFGSP